MLSVNWNALEAVLADKEVVVAAWVFGSAQEGQIGPQSDLDLGILFAHQPSLLELAELRDKLQQALQFDDIDVVVLNDASPITRFEAVSGRMIYTRDAEEVATFVSLTAREYEDSMALLRRGLVWRREAQESSA
ncbi:MAG: type VII toxin-antitoxin system MntA family adenylyltransferase antitoxin [Chloroflexota bacterium]